jgi:DNA-binding IclR family transcriptional regulator
MAELDQIRQQGYCLNDQELIEGLRAVGAPVQGRNGQVIGAISIAGPTHRLKGDTFESDLPDLLLGTVNELELNIVYS